jgi:hypothetical protein
LFVVLALFGAEAGSRKQGPLAAAAVAPLSSQDDEWATRFGQGDASSFERAAGAAGLKRSFRRQAVTRQAGIHERCGRGGWPWPHLFVQKLGHGFHGSNQIQWGGVFVDGAFVFRTGFRRASTENALHSQLLHNPSPHIRLILLDCSFWGELKQF